MSDKRHGTTSRASTSSPLTPNQSLKRQKRSSPSHHQRPTLHPPPALPTPLQPPLTQTHPHPDASSTYSSPPPSPGTVCSHTRLPLSGIRFSSGSPNVGCIRPTSLIHASRHGSSQLCFHVTGRESLLSFAAKVSSASSPAMASGWRSRFLKNVRRWMVVLFAAYEDVGGSPCWGASFE